MRELLSQEVKITGHDIDVVEMPFREPVHLPFGTINSRPSAFLTAGHPTRHDIFRMAKASLKITDLAYYPQPRMRYEMAQSA